MTIEAAVVLPLMILAVWILIFPLKVMESERRLQNRMEMTAKALAVTAYIRERKSGLLKDDSSYTGILESYGTAAAESFSAAALSALPETRLMERMAFSSETSVMSGENGQDPAMIHAGLLYSLRLPARVFRIPAAEKSLVVHRRAWVGSPGGRGREQYGGSDSENADDKIVYVGKSGTRYHLDPNCHYLSNKMSTADAAVIADLRSSGGAKYHACPSCRPGKTGTVYYFESGTAYHSTPSCKAITAYARAVPLHEVVYLGPCSYCGKKKRGG